MDLIKVSIKRPVTILSIIIMLVMFGMISLERIPYQLSPWVVEPEITVTTIWRGATPYEIEREIIEEQENTLKGLPNLVEMESTSRNSEGSITLKFKVGTNSDDVLLRVSNKLNEVPSYPTGVDKPVVTASGASASPVVWIIFKTLEGNTQPVETYLTYFEDEIRQHLERVRGVSDLFVGGGTEAEMHVEVSPERLAAYQLTTASLVRCPAGCKHQRIGRHHERRSTQLSHSHDSRVQDPGRYQKRRPDIDRATSRDRWRCCQSPVRLRQAGWNRPAERRSWHRSGARPEADINILEMTDQLEDAVEWLNEEKLRKMVCIWNGSMISASISAALSA